MINHYLLLVKKQRRSFCINISIRASHFTASSVTESEEISENQDDLDSFSSLIIQRKDLLRQSLSHSSGTGLHVLDLINRGSLEPDKTLYHMLLKRCTQFKRLKEGQIVHKHLLNSPFKNDLVMQNTILNMYAKCRSLDQARNVFDEMRIRDVVTWTVLISGYSQHDQPKNALLLFPEMLRQGFKPNQFTLSSLLMASEMGHVDSHGKQLHALCLKYGYSSNLYVGSALSDLYARYGHMEDAHFIFDGMAAKNEVSWNSLIAGHARIGNEEHVFNLFSEMLRENIQPTQFSCRVLLSVCANIGSLERGKWVHAFIIKLGAQHVDFVGSTLLSMYAKCGSIEDAKKIFNELIKLDVGSWNSMLAGYAQHGLGRRTLKKFKQMLRIGIAPNDITFLWVLTACSHAGLLVEGQHYFKLMRKYKVEPQISHYVPIVDLLGRAGHLDRAKKFIGEMQIAPTVAVWGALLGACRMHKNMELGTYAAECIFELDSYDSGTNMLLYNIYVSAGRWGDAAKVRKMMSRMRVKKEPACSWVELRNSVHVFVADDFAHPQHEQIRKMWEKINEKIKEIGYIPGTSSAHLFVDELEREEKLEYHSEKLALAFALVNTPPGSAIHINKNIRVCGDCHSAFKFVSMVVGRSIIVRDIKRFHHFRDGWCSCGDYW
ncbi:pentatricopeptide repeat-containing protein At3g24000, mitochondrial [Euphorbia lathyris]|uniref:pentatricopeptide repeat-containing protein At3g24000, mitochondrial n=1 Tax=Euphorbia lathyris TaxID=212925 RepID=UPI0033141693